MKTSLYRLLAVVMFLAVVLAACTTAQAGPVKAELPVDKAYANGKEIYFVHTEASDADSAKKMTDMFKSPVPYVAPLTQVPNSALASGADGARSMRARERCAQIQNPNSVV